MSKSGAWYQREKERKFGYSLYVSKDEPCRVCGKPYGDHAGVECPKEDEHEDKG